jgi:transcription termination factor Rho
MPVIDRNELEQSPLADLHAIASELGIEGYRRLRREELIGAILEGQGEEAPAEDAEKPAPPRPRRRGLRRRAREEEPEPAPEEAEVEAAAEDIEQEIEEAVAEAEPEPAPEPEPEPEEEELRGGILDILPNGSGFMRPDAFAHSREDVYVSPAQIRRCELRAGDEISGPVRPPRRSERYPSLVRVDSVNGGPPEPPAERPRFEDLTPVFATERLPAPEGLESAPFGKGSRVAVGGPPGAGATTLLRRFAAALAADPGREVVVVLAGVRPEEVTDWQREPGVTVAGGSFDRSIEDQAQAAEIAVERAKRAAENGRDAVIVIDSLDALPTGTGRRVFGAARNTEEAGSITVIASTGMAAEFQRVATTRIVLEPQPDGSLSLAPASGTTRADLLS